MSELKPCPFCGDTYIIVHHSRAGYSIGCNTINCTACHVHIKTFRTEEDAIDAWNRRAGDDPTIEPERKRGKWLPDYSNNYEERFICSVCGKSYKVDTCMGEPMWDFCPCGADMRQGKKSNV